MSMVIFKQRKKFGNAEKRILTILYAANKPLTTQEIANKTEMTRLTAKKYLIILQDKGKVEGGRLGKSIYWWLAV